MSKVEHLHQAMLFATADHGDNKMWAAFGPAKDFRPFLTALPEPPKRLYTVDVTAIMDGIEQRAKKAGIHLGNFFLPPDDPLFIKWITEFRTARKRPRRSSTRSKNQ